MAEVKKGSTARLFSLFIGFLGCVVVAVPIMFSLTPPVPMILIGSGVTVAALAGFLFSSL